MAARKGTILSDEHILKECAHYRPIPMKLAARIIDGNSVSAKESPFTSKKLKYQRQMSRPEHFDSYAHSIARNLGNDPEFRGKLHAAYNTDIAQHHNEVPAPAPGTPGNEAPPYVPPPNVPPPSLQGAFGFTNWEWLTNVLPALMRLEEQMNTPENQPDPRGYVPPVPNAPFVSQYNFGEDPASNEEPASNEAEGYESAQSASTDPVPELEPDDDKESVPALEADIDEVGDVNPDDPLPFGQPQSESEEEGPSSSTAPPPPRRSTRAGASRPAGFYSEAHQAARGERGDFFFQR